MRRYIDVEKIPLIITQGVSENGEVFVSLLDVRKAIRQTPTADVVEVVRCKDCKHCTLTKEGEFNPEDIVCGYFMTDGMQANDYCSYGERREQ